MILHLCDACGTKMGVWVDVTTNINAKDPNINVANVLYLQKKLELCTTCTERMYNHLAEERKRQSQNT